MAEIRDAYRLLSPLLGVPVASTLFALALLASGQNSTLTGTLAGQIVMEGFLNIRLRAMAAPADHAADRDRPGGDRDRHYGESGTGDLLVLSQVVLSAAAQLRGVPLLTFTGRRPRWARFVNPPMIKVLGWTTALIIIGLNVKLLFDTFIPESWRIAILRGLKATRMYRRILVALDHTKADESLLPHVAALAALTQAELLLVHVADGWAAPQLRSPEAGGVGRDARGPGVP